ncbi:MAG: hypothetical protein WB524_17455 [Acidobacteriaceae bacterium]|jgi:hypothetical protein
MLDVHAPEGGIHGWRGLLTHLFVITLGLLIALALEGGVEWIHHRHLAREARAELRTEFEENEKLLRKMTDAIPEQKKLAEQNLAAFDEVKGRAPDVHFNVTIDVWPPLSHSAWDTARETGAFEYMDYREVDSYATLVDMENEFMIHLDRLTHAYSHGTTVEDRLKQVSAGGSKQDINATADQGTGYLLDVESELQMCEWMGTRLKDQYDVVLGKQ